ncbi:probable WRKY transcription factor 32 [Prosopis cineraria]|uniref:probable WRKY transcription factor 32 n=1 Tax=Prosopis cineraria TaxID=364024 RepID=UPI00240FD0BA|nr:probable WRKY transcription factor 32 [Prosopis cineraria]
MADRESSGALMDDNSEHPESNESTAAVEEEQEKGEERNRVFEARLSEWHQGKLQSSEPSQEAEPNLETLAVPTSLETDEKDQSADLQASSGTQEALEGEKKEPVGSSGKELTKREAVQTTQTQIESQLQVSVCSSALSELSPTSVTQSLSSAPSPAVPEQRKSSSKVNKVNVLEVDQKKPAHRNTLSLLSIVRTSTSDGYNWRKYGQKQVKSPTGSRSYYRCTHSECCAKKIECCDHSGHVVEVVYKSQHSHDPPQKTNSGRESKFAPSKRPNLENIVLENPIRVLNDSNPCPSSKEPPQEAPCSADRKRQNSSDQSENGKAALKDEHAIVTEPKKRVKKGDYTCLDSPVKPGKKQKFVVHAAGDVGISGDGYRWRKYGQKMVKGNPHPRNYYRCTSAGCPVRKHIETAVDNSNAVIITYKGVHDHDMPVPKKRHGPPSAPLVAAAAPASMNNSQQLKKIDKLQKQKSSTQWSVDTEGELTGEALELGGEKAMESARTLLSIGFEIKPC